MNYTLLENGELSNKDLNNFEYFRLLKFSGTETVKIYLDNDAWAVFKKDR